MRNNGRRAPKSELYGAGDFFDTYSGETSEDGERVKPRKRAVRLDEIEEIGAVKRASSLSSGDSFSDGSAAKDRKNTGFYRVGRGVSGKSCNHFGAKSDKRASLSGDEGEGLIDEGRERAAIAAAMRIVSLGSVPERGLRDKLQRKGFSERDTDAALEYVKRFGYVDDQRLAQITAEKLAARHYGRYKICRYLASKGISSEVIENIDFSEIDFPRYCAELMSRYTPDRRDAMLRALRNAGYCSDDFSLSDWEEGGMPD